jgi:outer membrane biosynthesis protein TonB
LIKSSGSKEFDRSIIKAVQDSSPFSMINYLDENDRKEFDEILFKFMPEY